MEGRRSGRGRPNAALVAFLVVFGLSLARVAMHVWEVATGTEDALLTMALIVVCATSYLGAVSFFVWMGRERRRIDRERKEAGEDPLEPRGDL